MSPPATTRPKRDLIMDAALALFAQQGFNGVTVPQIAKFAGVGAGTLYHYFEGKEELARALYLEHKDRIFRAVSEDFPYEASARQRFREMFRRFVRFHREHAVATRWFHENNHSAYVDEICVSKDEQMQAWLYDFIERARADESVKDMPTELLISFVGGVFHGLFVNAVHGHIELTDELIDQAEQMAWEAVRR